MSGINTLPVATLHDFTLRVRPESFFGQSLLAKRTWEDAETSIIKKLVRLGDFCVDAGCHAGYFACLMAKCGAQVLAVDANPEHAVLACENARGQRIAVVHAALTDSDGQVPFHLPSLYDDGWGSIAAADVNRGTVIVPACRLDGILAFYQPKPGHVRLIKMDIEGAEEFALKGLGDRLHDVEYILVECVDIQSRVAALGSCVGHINTILLGAGFEAREFRQGNWEPVPEAYSTANYSFLFVNTRFRSATWRPEQGGGDLR